MEKHGEAKALPGGGHTILSNHLWICILKYLKSKTTKSARIIKN